jgi:starvation-inducible DNA-binding protein
MKTHIGLTPKTLDQVSHLLNELLADEFLLYIKTLKFHWNVQGIVFHDFHALFKELYESQLDICDEVAERARALGVVAFGTMIEFAKHTRLKEHPGKNPTALDMIKELLEDYEAIIRQIRKDIDITQELGDMGTNNFLTEIMERHEKTAWMLRATASK